MYNDRVPTCIPRSANVDLKYLPCEISRLPAVISEGSRDRGKPRWCSIKLSILVCVNAVVIIGEYKTKWSKQRKIIVKGGGSILFYYSNYLCALWLGAYRKLWSILKNVEMNHNKRALTRNRCQWSVYISWPEKGRYIYTCTTLRKQFFLLRFKKFTTLN